MPIPGRQHIHTIQGAHIHTWQITEASNDDNREQGVVSRQDGANLSSKERPGLGKVQGVGNVARQDAQQQGGILSRPFSRIDVALAKIKWLNQIATTQVNEGDANEELKDLRREWRDLPNQVDQSDHTRHNVHRTCPDAHPKEEGEVLRLEGLGESVGRTEKNGDGTSNAHNHQGLTGKDGVDDTNNGTGEDHLSHGEVVLGLSGHELGKNQRRDELNDECKDGGINDGKHRSGFAPVVLVQRSAGVEVLLDSRHELEQSLVIVVIAAAAVGLRGRRGLLALLLVIDKRVVCCVVARNIGIAIGHAALVEANARLDISGEGRLLVPPLAHGIAHLFGLSGWWMCTKQVN